MCFRIVDFRNVEADLIEKKDSPFGKSKGSEKVRVVFDEFQNSYHGAYWIACKQKEPRFLVRPSYKQIEYVDRKGNKGVLWINKRSFLKRFSSNYEAMEQLVKKVFPKEYQKLASMPWFLDKIRDYTNRINRFTESGLTENEFIAIEDVRRDGELRGEDKISKRDKKIARTLITGSDGEKLIFLSSTKRGDQIYGKGTYGKVKRAMHPTDPTKDRAVKMVRKDKVGEGAWAEIYNEVEMLTKLKGKSRVVHIDRYFESEAGKKGSGRKLYVLMEPCSGGELFDIFQLPVDLKRRHRLAVQCIEGLKQIHDQGIIHCDIKPENIFITQDDCVKIGDFGFSFHEGSKQIRPLGTVAYLAPERFFPQIFKVTKKSDIWSMGCTIFTLLTNKQFSFTQGKYEQVKNNLCAIKQKDLNDQIEMSVPPNYSKLLVGMLQLNYEKRITADQAWDLISKMPAP